MFLVFESTNLQGKKRSYDVYDTTTDELVDSYTKAVDAYWLAEDLNTQRTIENELSRNQGLPDSSRSTYSSYAQENSSNSSKSRELDGSHQDADRGSGSTNRTERLRDCRKKSGDREQEQSVSISFRQDNGSGKEAKTGHESSATFDPFASIAEIRRFSKQQHQIVLDQHEIVLDQHEIVLDQHQIVLGIGEAIRGTIRELEQSTDICNGEIPEPSRRLLEPETIDVTSETVEE